MLKRNLTNFLISARFFKKTSKKLVKSQHAMFSNKEEKVKLRMIVMMTSTKLTNFEKEEE